MTSKFLGILALVLVWGCAAVPVVPETEIQEAMKLEPDSARGKALYEHSCMSCHRIQGEGGGVATGVLERAMPKKNEDLYRTIKTGAGSWMPAFSQMTPQETVDVISYIRSLFPGQSHG